MIMTLDAGAAPAIDARKILFERRRFAISPAHHAVESAEAALSAGAIVGGYDHQRVVEFARPAQGFQNASELMVGLAELGCEHLHRSEERRVGKGVVSTCKSRGAPDP